MYINGFYVSFSYIVIKLLIVLFGTKNQILISYLIMYHGTGSIRLMLIELLVLLCEG
jgi:hypothetical protein